MMSYPDRETEVGLPTRDLALVLLQRKLPRLVHSQSIRGPEPDAARLRGHGPPGIAHATRSFSPRNHDRDLGSIAEDALSIL